MQADNTRVEENETAASVVLAEKAGINWPFLLTLLALLAWFGFQTLQQLRERSSLALAKESQDKAMQEAQKIQSQFQTIMTKTNDLAVKGHSGARMVMEELQKRGVGPMPQGKSADKPEPQAAPKPDIKSLK